MSTPELAPMQEPDAAVINWAADRIAKLERERDALASALRPIAEQGEISAQIIANARIALAALDKS